MLEAFYINCFLSEQKITLDFKLVPNDLPAIVGKEYTLECTVNGTFADPSYTYEWLKDGGKIEGKDTKPQSQATDTLHFKSLKFTEGGRYTCNVTVKSNTLLSDWKDKCSMDVALEGIVYLHVTCLLTDPCIMCFAF